jgi:hypothetical protein
MTDLPINPASATISQSEPANAKLVLPTLVINSVVAKLPLAMVNVALPSIGDDSKYKSF